MAKVAFLGLGAMGYPMAGHLKTKGGHEVTVYNRNAAKAWGIKNFYDVGRGGHGHIFPMESGLLLPGDMRRPDETISIDRLEEVAAIIERAGIATRPDWDAAVASAPRDRLPVAPPASRTVVNPRSSMPRSIGTARSTANTFGTLAIRPRLSIEAMQWT